MIKIILNMSELSITQSDISTLWQVPCPHDRTCVRCCPTLTWWSHIYRNFYKIFILNSCQASLIDTPQIHHTLDCRHRISPSFLGSSLHAAKMKDVHVPLSMSYEAILYKKFSFLHLFLSEQSEFYNPIIILS